MDVTEAAEQVECYRNEGRDSRDGIRSSPESISDTPRTGQHYRTMEKACVPPDRQSSQKIKQSKQDFSTSGWDLELSFKGAVNFTCFPYSIHRGESSSQYLRVSVLPNE